MKMNSRELVLFYFIKYVQEHQINFTRIIMFKSLLSLGASKSYK